MSKQRGPDLLVGCPVLNREWIIPSWIAFLEESCKIAGVTPEYIFVSDRRDPTRKAIDGHLGILGRTPTYVDVFENIQKERDHNWSKKDAFEKMVQLRNFLLGGVREMRPKHFLSLDSDILCHPDQVSCLLEAMENRDFGTPAAVGGRVYLSSGRGHPSFAWYSDKDGMSRPDVGYLTKVDVLMAMKLMGPEAYNVDYSYHKQGEDIGWSLNCRAKGLVLLYDGRVVSKHVMHEKDASGNSLIEKKDSRVGF